MVWLALVMGNSRFHWGIGDRHSLLCCWDTSSLSVDEIETIIPELEQGKIPELILKDCPLKDRFHLKTFNTPKLWLVSVIPSITPLWKSYSQTHVIELADLPLKGMYPTFGIDRALAVLGAGTKWGWPILVIDGGTALTLTGANGDRHLVGGAILPGLGLQTRLLAQHTRTLPQITLSEQLPKRWSLDTQEAIASGILYALLAGLHDFIQNWHTHYPQTPIILTGGDGKHLTQFLMQQYPQLHPHLHFDPDLIFLGIAKTAPERGLNGLKDEHG
ncbi:pantothenate kinase [Roseofilum sp. BLCC_M91]|uniref:Type III pantothenate kinase n=1 Tax=Roseofilum halophilum BLCC-M91 TaxID=3022259 RepID=A0ABT7BID7_9CYAN|nr:pantothenate kinase [Roseofilum halophilum]MDJ1178953.1 pantothenate kinase [Roseofilum halophilum BLCC-M91]